MLRALRGRRSRAAFSRWLGYRSNVAHRWETGAAWPTASRFLVACERTGVDVVGAYRAFFGVQPTWLAEHGATSPAAVAAFLRQLRGKTPISELGLTAGYNRYSVSRWLHGEAEPKLPQLWTLVEAASRRALDFLATLIDVGRVPSVAEHWRRIERARAAAYEAPWSHGVLRALETQRYKKARQGESALATTLGITVDEVRRALQVLVGTGQIGKSKGKWKPRTVGTVNTGFNPAHAARLRAQWMGVALERATRGHPGNYGYSLFAVSRDDLRKLQGLHVEYVRAMQHVIARSESSECVALYSSQLLDLGVGEANAFATRTG